MGRDRHEGAAAGGADRWRRLLDKGAQGSFTADLTPGDYGFICFVPDAKDGKPHLAHGMMRTITVN